MVTKLKKTTATDTPAPKTASKSTGKSTNKTAAKPVMKEASDLSGSIKDSAQQIWQAGLGAFMKAQAGGSKAFEALVKEGVTLQRKTQSAAEEKITEATQKMTSMATDITSKASGQWDKLESIFEDRVAKALNKLGVPSAKDIDALIARIDALNASVQQLGGSHTADKTVAAPVKKAAKPAAKPAAKSTSKAAVAAEVADATVAIDADTEVKAAPRKAAPRKAAPRKTSAQTAAATAQTGENPV